MCDCVSHPLLTCSAHWLFQFLVLFFIVTICSSVIVKLVPALILYQIHFFHLPASRLGSPLIGLREQLAVVPVYARAQCFPDGHSVGAGVPPNDLRAVVQLHSRDTQTARLCYCTFVSREKKKKETTRP